ncbi:MAG: efflux RND transporter periplasmic adaptor subunit [Myxococcales bacterium]|nr:efflux RND transporter periplasmic adaptor subunit [Myxococcales bacterium]
MAAVALAAVAVRASSRGQASAEAEDAHLVANAVPEEVVAPGATEGTSDVVELAFEVGGTVAAVDVEESASVKAGQVLARLDDRLARAELARAESEWQAARARRDAVVRGARALEVAAAEAEARAAGAEAAVQERESHRTAALLRAGAVGGAEAERARAAADAASARAAAAAARLALVKAGSRDELRREASAAVESARAAVDEATVRLSKTELRAPCDGVIMRRLVNPGERSMDVGPRPIVTLVDRSRLRVRAEVDEEDIGRVRTGSTGYATAPTYGARRFPGKVTRLTGQLGRRKVITDDPRARQDTRVLDVLFELTDAVDLPIGLRMDVHLSEQ